MHRLLPPILALVTLALPSCGPEDATDPALQAADSLVATWVESGRIPGAVLLVRRAGEVVLQRAYGFAQLYEYGEGQYGRWRTGASAREGLRRLREPRPMTTATVFDLASVTKVMATTLAVMRLVDEGRLELDAPVRAYLPDFRGPEKDRITLRHLLTHRSGLHQWKPVYYHAADADAAYAWVRDLPLAWPVGAERHYSDLGFMLLGRIVEAVTGRPLDAFVAETFYRPLGLRDTGFRRMRTGPDAPPSSGRDADVAVAATSHGNPFEYRMVHDSTFGYRIEGDAAAWNGWRRYTLVGEVNDGNAFHAFGGVAGHAGLFSTAGELGQILQMLLDGGVWQGERHLSEAVVGTFTASTGGGQALGWQVPDYAPEGSFFHTGFTGTYVLGVPERDLAVVLLVNRQNVGVDDTGSYPDVGPLREAVARALLEGG